jgi:hypothetical protein
MLARKTFAALIVVAVASAAADAAQSSSWTTFYPRHYPVTVQLPDTWQTSTPEAQSAFLAYAPTRYAAVDLAVGTYVASWTSFIKQEYKLSRNVYLQLDPNAQLHSRTVSLPGGRAYELIATFTEHSGGRAYPEHIVHYDFLVDGHQYDFRYTCGSKTVGTYGPLFDASARSIRFVRTPNP